MDVVALAQLGFANAVATLGTACTPEHVQKLFRFTDQVVFSFDGDSAGRRAARKALEAALPFASDTRSVKFLFLPAEHDPDSFIREFGAGDWPKSFKSTAPRSNLGARLRPASRADHAARLLLSRMDLWDALTAEDHAMLCELPPPHGTLFVWLDHQFHDQGALPWGQLRDQLAGRDFEAKAQELMGDYLGAGFAGTAGGEPGEARANCVA
jgi:hypothetical protein